MSGAARAWFAVPLALCACAHAPKVRTDATLILSCNVADARLYIDDALVGPIAALRGGAVAVPAGVRRVEVAADGWFTVYRDVSVEHAGRAEVAITMRRVPDTESAE